MKLNQFVIGIFFTVLSIGVHAEPKWEFVATSEGIMIGLDTNSISPVSEYGYQNNKKFWTKQVVVEDLIQDGLAVGDHRMMMNWINCNAKTYGVKSATDYIQQKNGRTKTDTSTFPTVVMNDIIPGTIGDIMFGMVCK